ncbi:MAG: glycoside hydrolase family 2 TIM barrel-domain containing protein [Bacteroidales bacterium]|nr:glycoside hydrolase family 2 TIM barrel-domain containing protein [Bacteroidales bacterium]
MKKFTCIVFTLFFLGFYSPSFAQKSSSTAIVNNDRGIKLVVDGKDFIVNGMNWDYFPIGTNYSYSLWQQPDDVIRAALDQEMTLLKSMGVNAIRQYTGVPPHWIEYIYSNYGIYTMLNHSFGRYGLTLDGVWTPITEYDDPRVKELLLSEVRSMVSEYKNIPGLLFFLLGNENNYGLFWDGAETEDIPMEDRKSAKRATHLYKLFNDAALAMKEMDSNHPVAICNGDVLFMEIIKTECPDVDIFGVNMYRGVSFGNAFQQIKEVLNKPVLFTEFGSDAFDAINNEENQKAQAYFLLGNWREIYENAYGMGKAGNSLGGFTFQFSDGWWKFGQTSNLSHHDNNASWSNGGYTNDFIEGENNMNEEWFGICAKGPTNERGLYDLYPRAAFYALQKAHLIDPFGENVTIETIKSHFEAINLMDAVSMARGDKALLVTEQLKKIRFSSFRGELTTFSTGGTRISTPDVADPTGSTYPNELGFDHMQSFYLGVEAKPNESFSANIIFNVLGNVAENPIDEIFYENRGRVQTVEEFNISGANGAGVKLTGSERLKVYRGDIQWNTNWFDMKSFYRTGHYHWGDEGDFFGLYPEANYGPNIDIYNGNAPFGFEFQGKKSLDGLKMAFGPELWWGANPAILFKY